MSTTATTTMKSPGTSLKDNTEGTDVDIAKLMETKTENHLKDNYVTPIQTNLKNSVMDEDISDVLYQNRHKKAEIEEQIRWRTPLWKSSGGQRAVHRSISSASSAGVREVTRDAASGSLPDSNYARSISHR